MQRVVDSRKRDRDIPVHSFLVKSLCSEVPVTFGEQQIRQRHTLPRGAQSSRPQELRNGFFLRSVRHTYLFHL